MKIMAPEEIFGQLSSWMVNFCLQSYTFLPLVYHMCGSDPDTQSDKGPEYGSHLDPDRQHWSLPKIVVLGSDCVSF